MSRNADTYATSPRRASDLHCAFKCRRRTPTLAGLIDATSRYVRTLPEQERSLSLDNSPGSCCAPHGRTPASGSAMDPLKATQPTTERELLREIRNAWLDLWALAAIAGFAI